MADRFRPNSDVVAQRLGDEIVLVQLNTDRMFVLNRTGVRLWELLSAGHGLAEIQARLIREFDVSATQLASDINALVESLTSEQLLTLADEPHNDH